MKILFKNIALGLIIIGALNLLIISIITLSLLGVMHQLVIISFMLIITGFLLFFILTYFKKKNT
ncbi:MAG: hypothetical protein AABY07_01320 [Nanoarchaeota archaeon]